MHLNATKSKAMRTFGLLIPLTLIALFLLFPVVSVLIAGFRDDNGFTTSYLWLVLKDGYYYKIFAFTLAQAILSTALSLIIGLPVGYFFGRYTFPGRKVLMTFFTVPFVLPSVLVGMGFLTIFGEQGLFGQPLLSIILAHAFYNIPLFVHYFSAYYRNFDHNVLDAAKTLGSKGWHKLLRVYLPLFLPPILTASVLTFVFSFLSYGVVLILGALDLFRTTETQIYAEYFEHEPNIAAILALLQTLVIFAVIIGYLFFVRKRSERRKSGKTADNPLERLGGRRFFKQPKNIALFFIFVLGLILELAPIVSIIITSFWDPHTAQFVNNFKTLFTQAITSAARISVGKAILNTLAFATGAAVLASILALITIAFLGRSHRKKSAVSIEMLTYLPLTISSVTLSLGITQTFINAGFFANHPWLFIIISQGLLGYPFITRALLNGLGMIDPEIIDAARTLGAKQLYKFRKIYLPLLLRSFLAGFAFALGISIGEFTTANFFANINNNIGTLTVVLYRLRSVRLFGEANAIGVLLLVISYIAFFVLEALGAREKTGTKTWKN
ncbi:MAG: hypothetical protein DRP02_00670 [Candidatus Gerdarchaeota archaeon]|nr:MAG: hypothetical protein DRP02_00670 [Candidatus Gerdarchaeota archaeon]